MGEGDLLFVAKEPNITNPRNLHLQRTKALTVPASLPPTDADMSHSNCDDSKFPDGKGKEVLVKSRYYVKTFVERSNHHSEKPIFSFLINQRRLNTRSNRPKELQRRRLRTEVASKTLKMKLTSTALHLLCLFSCHSTGDHVLQLSVFST